MQITKKIDFYLEKLSQLTKEEADFISQILDWTDQDKIAFKMAKRIFEENHDDIHRDNQSDR